MFRSLNISYLTFCPTGQVSSIKSSSIKYLIGVGGLLKWMYWIYLMENLSSAPQFTFCLKAVLAPSPLSKLYSTWLPNTNKRFKKLVGEARLRAYLMWIASFDTSHMEKK